MTTLSFLQMHMERKIKVGFLARGGVWTTQEPWDCCISDRGAVSLLEAVSPLWLLGDLSWSAEFISLFVLQVHMDGGPAAVVLHDS